MVKSNAKQETHYMQLDISQRLGVLYLNSNGSFLHITVHFLLLQINTLISLYKKQLYKKQ